MALDELERDVVSYFQEVGRIQGMDESFLKIFAILYLEPEPITMEELAEKTEYSPASISNKMKQLEPAGIIKKTTKPGSKRIYVSMEKDFLAILKKQVILKQEFIITVAKQRIPEIIKRHEAKARNEADKQRIRSLQEYYEQVKKAEKLLPKIIDLFNNA
ncbi:MarR family transcriptional regulator [Candidatus Woesearchaeota archaeon]|nr:MarR family transcriptional regulator [Candidatus Woesearchaeota archaeon]